MIRFYKYQGTGNDFILIDDRMDESDLKRDEIKRLCDRRFGIGADGLIIVRNKKGFDFEMLYYNSDGLPGSMCGNGGRCAVAFAHSKNMITDNALFTAVDGGHQAEILNTDPYLIKLQMQDVTTIEATANYIFLNTGSPHCCVFVKDVNRINVIEEGRKIRNNDRFKTDGTNVNFIELRTGEIYVRTYERGVEDETLSCGTGVTAAVLAAAFDGKISESPCKVYTPGGNLRIHFNKENNNFNKVWLEGPAVNVFQGEF